MVFRAGQGRGRQPHRTATDRSKTEQVTRPEHRRRSLLIFSTVTRACEPQSREKNGLFRGYCRHHSQHASLTKIFSARLHPAVEETKSDRLCAGCTPLTIKNNTSFIQDQCWAPDKWATPAGKTRRSHSHWHTQRETNQLWARKPDNPNHCGSFKKLPHHKWCLHCTWCQ